MNKIILFILIAVMLVSCEKSSLLHQNYAEAISFFKSSFIDHFPKTLDNNFTDYRVQYMSNYGNICFSVNAKLDSNKSNELIDSLMNSSVEFYNSVDTCLLVVNRFHNKDNWNKRFGLSEEDKLEINKDCSKNKLPIPNFYKNALADYGTECNLPRGFKVFVLEAKSGIYWDEKYLTEGRYMPEEWLHGYSKGLAISEVDNMIIYWFVIW